MNSNDFHYLSNALCNIIYHIPTSHIITLKKGTDIDCYFRQLLLNEPLLSIENFKELEGLITKEFDFIDNKRTEQKKPIKINLQSIILPISGHCNLRCSYCFAQNKGNFGFEDINILQAKRIIDYTFQNNDANFDCHINFFGGEPLLNIVTMEETIKYIKLKYSDRKVSFGITTNGTILNNKIIKLIKEHDIKLLLSYDGPLELGSHRTYINGKSTHKRVLVNMDLLKRNDIKFQLRATIPSDCMNLKSVYEHFELLNIPFAAILAYKSRNTDDSCIYDDERLNFFKDQYKILLNFYIDRIRKKLPINCYSIANDIWSVKNHEQREFSCTGGINLFAITDNGNIFSCEHLAFSDKYKIGNITTGVSEKALSKMQPQNVNTIEGCKNCWVRYLCGGGCFSEKILTSKQSGTLSEDECQLKRYYWEFILNLHAHSELEKTNFGI